MDMVIAGNRMHLGFAAQAAKRARKNNAVMVFVKRRTTQFSDAVRGLAESFAVEQGLPIQGMSLLCPGYWPLASAFYANHARRGGRLS